MRNILLTGAKGQLGWELQRTLAPFGMVTALDRQGLNLDDPDAIRSVVRAAKPAIIVNGAAYTAVDKAELEPDKAQTVNAIAPGIFAEEAKRCKALFVHFSTDYVFDGKGNTPYSEDDKPSPINVYGHTKLAGEKAIQAIGGNYLIFRTSWVYGLRGVNFLRTMLRLADQRQELRVVDDQIGTPTWSRMLAETTSLAIARAITYPEGVEKFSGLYHINSTGKTSWFGFAEKIMSLAAQHTGRKTPNLVAVSSTEYPTAAPRPFYTVLANDLLKSRFHLSMPTWEQQLELCLLDQKNTVN